VISIVKRSLLAAGAVALAFGILAAGSAQPVLAADSYQVRLVATPIKNAKPSFITALGDYLAWTGSYNGVSKMYVYDLVAGQNLWINPGPSGSYYNPAAEGDKVVFQGSTIGGYDHIYLYDREAKRAEIISSLGLDGERNDWNPRIQGGRVVWEKDTADPAAGSGIYLYDTGTRNKQNIIAGPEYRDPDIWGDYVVCVKNVASDLGPNASEIVLYNLNTADIKVISSGSADKNNEHPRIDGGKVVWSSGNVWTPDTASSWSTTYQICLYDIGSGDTSVLTDNAGGNLKPAIEGDLVAWQTWTPSAVKGYRISSGETFAISSERGGDTARSPEVDGTRVTWYGGKGLYYAVPASEATRFPDVPTGHHYLTAIEGVASQGIMTGYGDGNFGPNDWLIHQQFAQMAVLTMGYPVAEEDLFDFTDTPPIVHLENSLYPYHYVAVAALNGVVVAYGDGTFRPLYRERRNEAIEALVRAGGEYLAQPPEDYTGHLTDADAVTTEALRVAEFNGLLDNIVGPDGTLASWNPTEPATRAEMAQLLWNLLAKVRPAT
jgi:S-layer homology domain